MMRPRFSRQTLFVFLLTLGCGVGLWRFLVHSDATGWLLRSHINTVGLSKFFNSDDAVPQVRFVPCSIVDEFKGVPNVRKVTLREGPGEDAAIVAEVEMSYPVELLGATRDFVHVKYPDPSVLSRVREQEHKRIRKAEGWAQWGEIIADHSAAVLDAETGALVTRLLVPRGAGEVAFSPDAQRAIFYGDGGAREVLTTDYTTARCLHVTDSYHIASLFYQPDGSLYAVVFAPDESGKFRERQMNVVRVSDTSGPSQLTELSAIATDFQLSEDGRTGFILRRTDDWRYQVKEVEVVDLQRLRIRNSFMLDSDDFLSSFLLNKSGSELYLKPYRSPSVRVIDTRTGQRVREFPDDTKQDLLPPDTKVVGDALYFEDHSTTPYRMVLLNSAGKTVANPLLAGAVEAGGSLFSVNTEGTRLFKLAADGQIQASFSLERPEAKLNPEAAGYVFTGGLTAVPNSKRLLLFSSYSAEARIVMECSQPTKHTGRMKP